MNTPARAQTRVKIRRDMTSEGALREILATCAADFEAQLARLMATDDPEGPHGTRVALRRLRSALTGFKPLIGRAVLSGLKAEARALFRIIGPLRDADVRAGELEDASADTEADLRETLRAEVRQALIVRDAGTFGPRLRQLFRGNDWKRRGRKARRWRRAPVRRIAARALERAWSDCIGHSGRIVDMPVPDRHALRKELKTFRYLTDFFGPLWPGKAASTALDRLKMLQDALGLLNDIATIHVDPTPDPCVQAARERQMAEAFEAAEKNWRKLRKARRWWR